MTAYIKLSTLEFPRHEGDIRIEHPEITEDQTGDTFPCPDTYAPVVFVDQPEYDQETQRCELGTPVNENGEWRMTWVVRAATPEEIESAAEWKRREAEARAKVLAG